MDWSSPVHFFELGLGLSKSSPFDSLNCLCQNPSCASLHYKLIPQTQTHPKSNSNSQSHSDSQPSSLLLVFFCFFLCPYIWLERRPGGRSQDSGISTCVSYLEGTQGCYLSLKCIFFNFFLFRCVFRH